MNADGKEDFLASGKLYHDSPMRIIWKRGFIRLVLVAGIIWGMLILTALLFHAWSCQSSIAFFSGNYFTFLAFFSFAIFMVVFAFAVALSYIGLDEGIVVMNNVIYHCWSQLVNLVYLAP